MESRVIIVERKRANIRKGQPEGSVPPAGRSITRSVVLANGEGLTARAAAAGGAVTLAEDGAAAFQRAGQQALGAVVDGGALRTRDRIRGGVLLQEAFAPVDQGRSQRRIVEAAAAHVVELEREELAQQERVRVVATLVEDRLGARHVDARTIVLGEGMVIQDVERFLQLVAGR